jgi:predicted outer membrane repeat protein
VPNPYKIANNKVKELGMVGIEGGENADLIMENVQFHNNTAANKGSALYISQSSAHLTSTSFIGNKAFEAGTVLIESNSFIEFNDCTFQENWGDDASTIYA